MQTNRNIYVIIVPIIIQGFLCIQVFKNYNLLVENVDGINWIVGNVSLILGVGTVADYCIQIVIFLSMTPNSLTSTLFIITTLVSMLIASNASHKVLQLCLTMQNYLLKLQIDLYNYFISM